MDRNQQVLAAAFKKAKRKINKIKELGVTPDMDEDAQYELVKRLAEAKAIEEGSDMSKFIDGQTWYVQSLVEAAAMQPQELLDAEYDDSFADIAGEDDMLKALTDLAA